MAMQGLFTQGPSVQDILAKRNKSQFDMQQQLMNQAAQGARDPAKMRAVSLLGSSLGRALGGAMGGQDEELAKREAEIAAQAEARGDYFKAAQGTSADMYAMAQGLQKVYPKAALDMLALADAKKKDEQDTLDKEQKEKDTEANLALKQTKLNNKGKYLASQLPKNHPLIEELQGDFVTQAMLTSARSSAGGYFDTDIASEEEKALQLVRNEKGKKLANQLGNEHPLYQGLVNKPTDALLSQASNVSVDIYDRGVEQTEQQTEAASEQLLRTTTATALSASLPADHPLQEQLKNKEVTQDILTAARKATTDAYSLQVAEGKVTASQQEIKARLEKDSTSLALTLGKEKYPQLYAQLTTSPTAKIYAEAVKELDVKESTEKGSDIVAKYWGTVNGKTVRIGDTRNGTQVQLTGNGHVPITGEVSQPSTKTEVTETPLQIARTSYEYVQKSPDAAKLAKIYTLSDRVADLVKFTDAGSPKAVSLLYRTVSELYNGDTRAASEILALKEAGTIPQNLFDSIAGGVTGQLTQETRDQLVAVADAGARAHNRTMGRIVSQEYKSRVGNFEDPSVLQQQMLVFFNSSDIMDIDGPLDPTEYPEGKQFLGTGEYEGKEYMVIAGNIVEL